MSRRVFDIIRRSVSSTAEMTKPSAFSVIVPNVAHYSTTHAAAKAVAMPMPAHIEPKSTWSFKLPSIRLEEGAGAEEIKTLREILRKKIIDWDAVKKVIETEGLMVPEDLQSKILCRAAKQGDKDKAIALLKYFIEDRRLNIDAKDDSDTNLLYVACDILSPRLVKFLLEHGADTKIKSCGDNPYRVFVSAAADYPEVVSEILKVFYDHDKYFPEEYIPEIKGFLRYGPTYLEEEFAEMLGEGSSHSSSSDALA